ncbi:CsbD family protein [Catellatospora aurea]|uniref:CsbD family protein n=1 Tax=Catellatospora aurea TaxID=1337874 RepID=A0ABW2GPR5_9ACTN
MGTVDSAKHHLQDLKGKVKEHVGDVTDNHSLQAEGIAEQVEAKAAMAADDVRDAVRGRDDDRDDARN